jgi:hypothetical protein
MIDRKTIQNYINSFRVHLSRYLKPGTGVVCKVYPAERGGAILEFSLGPGIQNDDIYQETSATVGTALSGIPQKAFGGNLEGFAFGGTNTIMEGNRIIFIKDDSLREWGEDAALNDVQKLLPKKSRAGK